MSKHDIERLEAEVERLREQVASLQATSGYEASITQLEVERLQADNEQLRAALQEIHDDLEDSWAKRRALAALEPKR